MLQKEFASIKYYWFTEVSWKLNLKYVKRVNQLFYYAARITLYILSVPIDGKK